MIGSFRSALLFGPSAFAFSLGVWQVQRLDQKKTELAHREGLVNAEPLDLNLKFQVGGGGEEGEGGVGFAPPERNTPVTCRGTFLHDRSIYVGPRVRSELGQALQGCMLITPLELEGGEADVRGGREGEEEEENAGRRRSYSRFSLFGGSRKEKEEEDDSMKERKKQVLVLRGWVPKSWKESPEKFDALRPKRSVQVDGLVKTSDTPGYFAPPNSPEQGQWFYYDLQAMAQACGIDVCQDQGGGKGKDTTVLVEEIKLSETSETKKVKLSTAMDVLAFRTDRNRWKASDASDRDANGGGGGGEGGREELDGEIRMLMSKLNTQHLPIRRTLGDFLRFNVTPQDHMNYAATWFTLSFCTAAMAYASLRSARSGKQWWYFGRKRRRLQK